MSPSAPVPRALRLVALLFLLQGIGAIITIVVCMLHNKIQLDFDVLGIFVYFGLHRLSSGWRTCALVLTLIGVVVMPVFAFASFFVPYANINFFGVTGPAIPPFFATLTIIFWFGVALWQWSVLKRPDVVALFERRRLAGLDPRLARHLG